MVRVTGSEQHLARFERSEGAPLVEAIAAALLEGARDIASEAQFSIIQGSVSGPGHVPSAPGEPPNADTHELDRSIDAELISATPSLIKAQTRATSAKAVWLEGGTSRMAERPFMGPAARKKKPTVERRVAQAVSRILKGR